MKVLKSLKRFIPMAATLAVAVSFGAHAQEKKGVTESELKYQAGASPLALLPALGWLALKLAGAGMVLALIETVSAKLRIFRAPEFLAMAFMLAVLGLLVHLLLGS